MAEAEQSLRLHRYCQTVRLLIENEPVGVRLKLPRHRISTVLRQPRFWSLRWSLVYGEQQNSLRSLCPCVLYDPKRSVEPRV